MDVEGVCTPLTAESDALNNTLITPNVASMTDADKVINTKLDSTQVEGESIFCHAGDKSEKELLKGLLTDDYCHVCEAVLRFEPQRLSHYEGKKHAQRLRVYLQAKRAERMNKDSTGSQLTTTTDKDRFCELCNMVFSSSVVARSHYMGKVHAKNLGKKGLKLTEACKEVSTLPGLTRDSDDADQNSAADGDAEHQLDPKTVKTTSSTEVDLEDPNKYCKLCAAPINNPQVAFQHYNGRKHQRNQARQELLRELGDDVQQDSLTCQMCSLQFNSVEMYQAHMQGNKHQTREKKVTVLCKSQKKVYSTFADELSDYIQVQKARGINTKTTQVKGEEDDAVLNKGDIPELELNKPVPNLPHTSNLTNNPRPRWYNPSERWVPPHQGSPWPSHGWHYNCPPPVFPGTRSATFTSWPLKKRSHREQSSSSSYNSSSSYSSYSSSYSCSASDSDDSEYRRPKKRRIQRLRRERDKMAKGEDSDKMEKRKKRQRRERNKESENGRIEDSVDLEGQKRQKKLKGHERRERRERKLQEEDFKVEEGERVVDRLMPELMMDTKKERGVHIKADMNIAQGGGGGDESSKPKYRKEKKKTKEKADNRTEDEKLWDDSILGC